jgi:methyltransferase
LLLLLTLVPAPIIWFAERRHAQGIVTQGPHHRGLLKAMWWAIATLGTRWCTRIIVLPGAPPVTGGPYRWLRHPNYLAVVVELAALPLAFGSWRTALAFSSANAALLAVRIRAEERALGAAWGEAFRGRRRLVPGRPA